jgi:restriction system protein
MAVPDFQSIMLPMLKLLGDKKERRVGEMIESLSDYFELSEEEKKEPLTSKNEPVFHNRVRWTLFYLRKAELVNRTKRGVGKITKRGLDVLKSKPKKIDMKFLEQFPEYKQFRNLPAKKQKKKQADLIETTEKNTPQDLLDSGYKAFRNNLVQELKGELRKCDPSFFEKLVVDLLVAMGYGGSHKDAAAVIGKSGDEGIDGLIKEDRLGLDVIYLQAKRWENTVGRQEIQKFAGALQGKRAKKGVFITTSDFTKNAHEYVNTIEAKIILIDGEKLTQLMIDYDLGVSPKESYQIKELDSDYFE